MVGKSFKAVMVPFSGQKLDLGTLLHHVAHDKELVTISNQLLYHVARLLDLAVFKSMKGTTASVTDIVAEVHDLSSAIDNKPSELRVKLFEYMEGCMQLTWGEMFELGYRQSTCQGQIIGWCSGGDYFCKQRNCFLPTGLSVYVYRYVHAYVYVYVFVMVADLFD